MLHQRFADPCSSPAGGFVAGEKRIDDIFFGNLGGYFASKDVLCVIANYRLAPVHAWHAGAEDVGHVLAWIKENAAKHGGDPTRIFFWGLSSFGADEAKALERSPIAHATKSTVPLFLSVTQYDPRARATQTRLGWTIRQLARQIGSQF
jgi:hypothetical protein